MNLISRIFRSDSLKIFTFIFSSQIGSGAFILPSILYLYGKWSFFAFIAIGLLSIVLTKMFIETGLNCHQIIRISFGDRIAKYIFWLYWFISWFSSIVVVKELVSYLNISSSGETNLLIEAAFLFVLTFFNMAGERNVILLETIITILKIIPVLCLYVFFFMTKSDDLCAIQDGNIPGSSIFLKCLWCFFGLESGSIIAKKFSIGYDARRKGTYWGMLAVIIYYLSIIFFGFILAGDLLLDNPAPFRTIFSIYLGSVYGETIIRCLATIVLIGTINSWIVTTGLIGYDGAREGLLPKIFTKTRNNVPYISILIPSVLIFISLIPFSKGDLYRTMTTVIDATICFAFFIYGLSAISYGKSIRSRGISSYIYYCLGVLLLVFFIYSTSLEVKVLF